MRTEYYDPEYEDPTKFHVDHHAIRSGSSTGLQRVLRIARETMKNKKAKNPTPPPPEMELIKIQEVAKLLTCSMRHVHRMADAGRMPRPIKLGRIIRWRRVAILEWIEADCPDLSKKRRR